MRLSEREKKYVLILSILLLLAALYYAFTAAVEPFLAQKAESALILADLQQQELIQQTKLKQREKIEATLQEQKKKAIEAVVPFYPALPQDKLLLLVQDLIQQSGLIVNNLSFSGLTVAEPGFPADVALPLSYTLKTLADSAAGRSVEVPQVTEAASAQPDLAMMYGVPQANFVLSFTGEHTQVSNFIRACEALGKTVSLSSMNEAKGEDGQMTGTLSLVVYAVEKPEPDPFFDWTLEAGPVKTELFDQQYAAPVTDQAVTDVVP